MEHAKSIAYKRFLETDCTHFFNVDADIFFFYEDVSPIDLLIEQDKDIVSGIYVYKRLPCLPTHRPMDLQEMYEKDGKFPSNYKFIIPNEIHEIMFGAGGCMMIKKDVIEKLVKKYQVPNLPMIYKKEYLSEDFAFCKRARDEGYKIYGLPNIKLGHCGNYYFTLDDYNI
ncbi:MAG: glycosyltransferase family 2 protein [Candidatus Thorarchaeota archaeon]